ncbi:MAG: MBL fold metallo-hydrolase [Sphingomonadaceae bacterium]|nr:MBL fold metallo-hydrolase [Sphingomonadaceae bacterium]
MSGRIIVASAIALVATAAGAQSAAPPFVLSPGVAMIAGSFERGRQPDGNSVMFDAPDGLIVVDTGRHRWHHDRISAFAATRDRPVAAIVNTHWHLDHISGNIALTAEFPAARVYATPAIDGALTGFLADGATRGREALATGKLDPVTIEEIETDLATIAAGAKLRPDVVVERSGAMTIAGRPLGLQVAANAATEADLWLYDPATRIAVVGDLVTLPAPFLDTACPEGWRKALGEVAATPFTTLVPGHGAPMTRAQFNRYRGAFDALLDCAATAAAASLCADRWAVAVAPLLGSDERAPRLARSMTAYYIEEMLRADGGKRKYCPA